MRVDCDGDTILLLVDQQGPACHEGYRSCFFRRIDADGVSIQQERLQEPEQMYGAAPTSPFDGASRAPGKAGRQDTRSDLPPAPRETTRPSQVFGVLAVTCCLLGWLSGQPTELLAQTDFWSSFDRGEVLAEIVQTVDARLAERWEDAGVVPAAISKDAEFLRRLSLDITGVAPSVAELHEFLTDTDPQKRARWIGRLTRSPRYATHMAGVWRNTLLPGGVDLQQEAAAEQLENWLRRQFHQNLRYDNLVAEFLTANGPANDGPGLFYTSLELKPEKLAASTSRIFLGLQIQCAECHDHPFDHWKQKDFWGYAAFFARLRGRDQPMASARIADAASGEVTLPESTEIIPPKYPGGSLEYRESQGPRRVQLAIWMASRDNPFLARAAVNRAWALMFGRGLVEPVDDLRPQNPASHPELLEELTEYFIRIGFDWRLLLETLANTQAYQRSSIPAAGEAAPPELFASMAVKTLTPEQLYDSLRLNIMRRPPLMTTNTPFGAADAERFRFVQQMRGNARNALEYAQGVPQALTLMNGGEISAVTSGGQGLLAALQAPFFDDTQRIDNLFLATVSRFPDKREKARCLELLEQADSQERLRVFSDILWALLNSVEFAMCP